MRSPVLFLVFNRPEPTAEVFAAIRAAKPPRLYVAADGARPSRLGEAQRCEETRRVATAVDWACEVKTLFREQNLGCKRAVSGALDWFFECEEEGIILEDDCVPDPTFFRYCDELLERYRDDERVALISGDNFQFGRVYGESSYYFSRYAHIWGWASWRRTWRHYDRDVKAWPAFRDSGGLEKIFGARSRQVGYWRQHLDAVHQGRIDTWDYQLNFTVWVQHMMTIMPQKNLVKNIGFGNDATHTTESTKFADLRAQQLDFPLRHPTSFDKCAPADDFTAAEMFSYPPFAARVIRKLKSTWRHRMRAKA
jgi:hypothetical protein